MCGPHCHPRTWEAEAREFQVSGQPRLSNEVLSQEKDRYASEWGNLPVNVCKAGSTVPSTVTIQSAAEPNYYHCGCFIKYITSTILLNFSLSVPSPCRI